MALRTRTVGELLAWAAALVAVLQVHYLPGDYETGLCGVWG